MFPKKLTNSLDIELDLLWSTWSGLGLYAQAKPLTASPETCLVGMACIGHFDQRLFDEALSLVRAHPGIIRVPFVKYWAKMMDPNSQCRLNLILDFCKIPKLQTQSTVNPPENFFKNTNQTSSLNGRQLDPYFEKFGYKRNPFLHSNHVPELTKISDMNPFVKMRLTSGFQAQSDVWVYLLHFKELTIPKIQSLLGVTAKSAWNVLQNMHQAGWVTKKSIGKIDFYKISPNANKAFSFIKATKIQCTPGNWIKLAHRISIIGDKVMTDKYFDFLDDKLTRDFSDLETEEAL